MHKLRILILVAALVLSQLPSQAQSDATSSDPLLLSSYIAWWAHDDRGYHPAVTFVYQNESGDDLSDQLIRFQARFLEIKNNYLSVTRNDIRGILEKGQQKNSTLIGSEPYELPIDANAWPTIECKVLYKIGDESEAHQLLLARVDRVTMTNEEALQRILSQTPGHPRQVKRAVSKRKRHEPPSETSEAAQAPEAPLAATALPLNGRNGKDAKTMPPKLVDKKPDNLWHFKNGAGLSDDFFQFEQAFGRPTTFDASSAKWTWAKYQPPGDVEIYAGARQPASKTDIVVAFIKSRKAISEPQLVALGKEFIGKYKSQPLGSPVRTVRYLPTGRVQITNLAAPTYHFSIFSTNDSPEDNRYYVVLSRLPSNAETTLLDQARRSKLIRFMLPVLGDAGDQQ